MSQFGLAPRNPIRIRQSGPIGNRGVTLQPNGTMPVIHYPVHRKHRLNSIRDKMQNDNENEKVHDLCSKRFVAHENAKFEITNES